MTTRIVQLVARGLGVAFAALAAKVYGEVSPETLAQLQNHADIIAAGLVGLAMFGVDLWLHRKRNKSAS